MFFTDHHRFNRRTVFFCHPFNALLDDRFRGTGSRGHEDAFHTFKPLFSHIRFAVDQMGCDARIGFGQLTQALAVGAVLAARKQNTSFSH